jgi:signal transduction histidine kinase/DNA-binding LacI/PurR family transcriptional regulator/DNA-binding response OmpR family regulator
MPLKSQPPGKPTVAFFSSSPGGSFRYEKWQMWRGVAEAARELGFNLVYVAGEEFERAPQAALYHLIDRSNVSGLIFWHSFVGPRTPVEMSSAFVARFQPLPVVSLELALEGCANIVLDNDQGMGDLLSHLVEKHHYQRIAFLYDQRNATANQRRAAFERALRTYGLFDPDLLGSMADLDARSLLPGRDYHAILTQSDDWAVEAVETLRQRGLSVPEDVAVAGINDGYEARGSLPPLTTLRIPFRKVGRQAVVLLAEQIAGRAVPGQHKINLQLVTRRSCGCLEPMAEGAAVGPRITAQRGLLQMLSSQRPAILLDLARSMGTSIESLASYWAEDLLDIFVAELKKHAHHLNDGLPSRLFLESLGELLHQAIAEDSNISRWHEALSTMRRHMLPFLDHKSAQFAEDLWQQARVLVGQTALRAEIHHSWRTSMRTEKLRELQAGLLVSSNETEMLRILAQGLPGLGISGFFLVQYENGFDPDGWGRLSLVYQDGQAVEPQVEEGRFPLRQLLPPRWLPSNAAYSLVLEALHVREEQIGYLVFLSDPPADASACDVFQALRIQISSALKGVGLRQALAEALQQAEEANALKSRFLSMVSHELRTPLNLIVGLSEMALRQQTSAKKNALAVLRKYHEQIYISGQHLDRLIRDVLDLASSQVGQMKLISKPLDLVPVLQDVACMASQLAEQKNLEFRAHIPERLPPIYGDKTRLRQVMLNLLSNAVKFTARGEVFFKAEVSSADQIVITVKDTGLGIPLEDQERIFDEFSQSNRTAVRGYGGIGLGLAITRLLVEMHGGSIWVTSDGAEGQGSAFSFTLPVMTSTLHTEQEPSHARQGVVLILSQTAQDAQSLSVYLVQQGFIVETLALEDAPDILENIRAAPPGALVLDMAPAAEQGWEIMRELKQNPATQDIPVLFYSLLVEQDAGAVLDMDYLTKPISAEQLSQALKRFGLGSQRSVLHTVLLVDDEPGILELHSRLLQAELPNCQILTARDGKQGLELMREFLPDLVLLDLMMPVLDGFGVLKAMQVEQLLSHIPVIVLSGQALTEREMDQLNKGVSAVMAKGVFSSREILKRIQAALARDKRLGTEAHRLVRQAMVYMHENYKEPISRHKIADHLCVNEQYLSRCFSNELGIGPMSYLSRYRIQQAKRLLEKRNLSITQVALEVGLSSQSYFSRLFQKEVGVTPSAYQRGERPLETL